jgi:hypothetical protein
MWANGCFRKGKDEADPSPSTALVVRVMPFNLTVTRSRVVTTNEADVLYVS